MPRIKEQALKAELAKRGFESVSIKRELPGGLCRTPERRDEVAASDVDCHVPLPWEGRAHAH